MNQDRGIPFTGLTEEEREAVEIVVTDVDDTITRKGKLYPEALRALWKLKTNGKMVILLTGGSAGWADAYIRQWPVDAVIAEGGALILAHGPDTYIWWRLQTTSQMPAAAAARAAPAPAHAAPHAVAQGLPLPAKL